MDRKKVLIVIPAYNEGTSIFNAVKKLREVCPEFDVLVVNDGSTDNTASEALRANVKVLNLIHNIGIGGAVQSGFIYARKENYDVAVQFDGDNQHPPGKINALVEALSQTGADILIGSRFINNIGFKSTWLRMPGIFILSKVISLLTGNKISDTTSGFRAFSKNAVTLFAADYPQKYPEPECLLIAYKNGLSMVEIPVRMRERAEGTSSINFLIGLHYMFTVLVNLFINYFRGPKKGVK